MSSKWLFLLIGLLFTFTTQAKTINLPHNVLVNISGYLGWRQIISDVDFDSIPSEPEMGLTTSIALTDRLTIFNQFKYGTSINSIFVYNQIDYTPDIPINDFILTLKGGKIRYDNTLFNITRINPRTRQGIFQPQSMYWNTLAQTITSGYGFGFDVKYKDWSGSYIVDKQIIVNPKKESRAWTTQKFDNIASNFGDHQVVSMQYEFPQQKVRVKSSWNKTKFKVPTTVGGLFGNPNSSTIGVEYVTLGVEWDYDNWHTSLELQSTKRDGATWSHFNDLAYGGSVTLEYDINENWTVRTNANAYQSSARVSYPQEKYNRDLNLGVNWHSGSWMTNIEGHWIHGGRIVDPDNFAANPNDYKSFCVVGMNLVYFWE